ncbi:SURF1 family protein [Motilibacter rhizosphaerae]|uniref:SURF1 family protein n=1 Tax=Motilibacter rhizosphaerae TaxID=598652 RepID=UPI0013EED884|nr:SURF1 family protein [Motilibacter rhizosphaerae]
MRRDLWTTRALPLHLALLVALAACAALGWWQWDRWESQRRGSLLERPQPPVVVTTLLQPSTELPDAAAGRSVTARGHYLAAGQLVLPARALHGRRGSWVLSALRLDSGAVVTVVRGWVAGTPVAAPPAPAGEVLVSGRLQPTEPVLDQPDPALAPGQATAASPVELLGRVDGPFDPGLLVASAESPSTPDAPARVGLWLRHADPSAGLRNLAYALQWWAFGAFAVFLWWRALALQGLEREAAAGSPRRVPDELPETVRTDERTP